MQHLAQIISPCVPLTHDPAHTCVRSTQEQEANKAPGLTVALGIGYHPKCFIFIKIIYIWCMSIAYASHVRWVSMHTVILNT